MEQELEKFIENNEIIKQYFQYPIAELKIIRMFINFELEFIRKDEKSARARVVRTCTNESYNYLDYVVSMKNKIDIEDVSTIETLDYTKQRGICEYCSASQCLRKSTAILIDEINKYNAVHIEKLKYLTVIDYILGRKIPEFESVAPKELFEKVDLIDLMYVQVILESDLISLSKVDNDIAEFSYLDLTKKNKNEYYINVLIDYYKNNNKEQKISINIKDEKSILDEKERMIRIYKIAAYYKYLIEIEKIDVIKMLREILLPENNVRGLKVRVNYFIYRFFQKVEKLPYTQKTKDKIYDILNYILNYRYKKGTPFIPINILIYSNDKEGVERICKIIGETMWFFGYLPAAMNYYSEYINNIILDKFLIKKLYYDANGVKKSGILLLHNFENLLYTDYLQQNLILNILTDEMEKNNNNVCTIIYGEREMLEPIISNHYKLSQRLINLELEIDNISMDKAYELVVKRLEENVNVSEEIKEKIYNYIKATYMQSDIQNMDYVNKLYNRIILNMNKRFSLQGQHELCIDDIPEAYNTKDLHTIMKELNALVGLSEIKEQISDLVALLKFNKKANIDINNFNLHMIFSGNPGTGKTTVARLIKDIFFNLGYIKQNKMVEVTAKDLIAEYIGQTSGKTYNVVKSALGGVLFIDEAYAITSGVGDGAQYGNECIATLLKLMEDYKDKLIIIFAGYEDEMKNFVDSNQGLISRIGYKINFPDYTIEELTQIYINLLKKNNLEITTQALDKLQDIIREASKHENFGNARYINTVFQKILIEHSKNMDSNGDENLYKIDEQDINYEKLIDNNTRKKIGF